MGFKGEEVKRNFKKLFSKITSKLYIGGLLLTLMCAVPMMIQAVDDALLTVETIDGVEHAYTTNGHVELNLTPDAVKRAMELQETVPSPSISASGIRKDLTRLILQHTSSETSLFVDDGTEVTDEEGNKVIHTIFGTSVIVPEGKTAVQAMSRSDALNLISEFGDADLTAVIAEYTGAVAQSGAEVSLTPQQQAVIKADQQDVKAAQQAQTFEEASADLAAIKRQKEVV